MRTATFAVLMTVVLVGSASAGVSGATAQEDVAQMETQEEASVSIDAQTSGGTTVVVDSVTLPEGGFVVLHDSSLGEGNVLGSVVGASGFLEAGTHRNVTVRLSEPLSADATLIAMAHRDTDGDRVYSFTADNGETDGPYTAGDGPVTDDADVTVSATVSMSAQPTDGDSVVVDRVELSEGGFVTIHDGTVTEGRTFESIRGTSEFLPAGVHHDVRVQLDDNVTEETTLVPMAHRDTNGDGAYTFAESEGSEDGPYLTTAGEPVVDTATVTPRSTASVSYDGGATGGHAITVGSAFLPEGGFVTVHDGTVTEGQTFESIRGTSGYLEPGLHRNVEVVLDDPVANDTTLVPMAHRDTDDDETYTFDESSGDEDGPYTANGSAVVDSAEVTVSATATLSPHTSDGHTVIVESVDLSEGGFVTIHDARLSAGQPLASVVGTSQYLEAGHHEDVTVTVDEPLRTTQRLVAMPHRDTNDNQQYDFVDQDGAADGPYTANGSIVTDDGQVTVNAVVTFANQSSDGDTVTVDSVTLHDGGFVTVHDGTLLEGQTFESIRGTSQYLGPGTHENVEVTLDDSLTETTTLVPMPHRDTDGDETYTFAESQGQADGPYTWANGAVVTTGTVTVESMGTETPATTETATPTPTETTTPTPTPTETTTPPPTETSGSGPGFGIIVGLLAMLGATLLATRDP